MRRQIAILFDVNKLGRGPAVYNAYARLFQVLEIEKLVRCKLYHGKAPSGEPCVCFEPNTEEGFTYLGDALREGDVKGLADSPRRFQVKEGISDEYFLVFAGAVNEEGILQGSGKMAMHFPLIVQETSWRKKVSDKPISEEDLGEAEDSMPEVAVEPMDVVEVEAEPIDDASLDSLPEIEVESESVPYVEIEAVPLEDDPESVVEVEVQPVAMDEQPKNTWKPPVSAPRPSEIMRETSTTIVEYGRVIPVASLTEEDPIKFAVKIGWKGYLKHPFRLPMMILAAAVGSWVPLLLFIVVSVQGGNWLEFVQKLAENSLYSVSSAAATLIFVLLFYVLQGGVFRTTLQDMRGKETRFSDMFSGLRRFFTAGLTILPMILFFWGLNYLIELLQPSAFVEHSAWAIGLYILIVFLSLVFGLFNLLLLLVVCDQGVFGLSAFVQLFEITKKHVVSILLMTLLLLGGNTLGGLLFFVGWLVTIPLSVAMVCAFYERLQVEYYGRDY